MANTIDRLLPGDMDSPASDFPKLLRVGTDPKRFVLAFDAATPQAAYWTRTARQGLTGTLKLLLHYFMASATSGKIDFEASIEAVTPGDTFSMVGAASFDTVNAANETVPGTVAYPETLEITLTNKDSIAAGDQYRVKLERDADDGTDDTAAGDCYVTIVEIQDDV